MRAGRLWRNGSCIIATGVWWMDVDGGEEHRMPEAADLRPLLERCQRHDRAAFAELFERYHQRVFRSAYVIAHRPEAADDITQLVFVELFSALRRYDLNRPFLPWLYRIVHNISVDYHKRNRRAGETIVAMDGQL